MQPLSHPDQPLHPARVATPPPLSRLSPACSAKQPLSTIVSAFRDPRMERAECSRSTPSRHHTLTRHAHVGVHQPQNPGSDVCALSFGAKHRTNPWSQSPNMSRPGVALWTRFDRGRREQGRDPPGGGSDGADLLASIRASNVHHLPSLDQESAHDTEKPGVLGAI